MIPAELLVLGTASGTPTLHRNPSGMLLTLGNFCILIDCGEGTQYQLMRGKKKLSKIDLILISHLHPDHYAGLFPLLTSSNWATGKRAKVIGPPGIARYLQTECEISGVNFESLCEAIEIQDSGEIFSNLHCAISAHALEHRITCYGFRIDQKAHRFRMKREAIVQYGLSVPEIKELLLGKSVSSGDLTVTPEMATYFEPGRSFGYITDTLAMPALAQKFRGVNMLYHEATFEHGLIEKAIATFHSTATQAAEFACNAEADRLLIGHFSARYHSIDHLLAEARTVFHATDAATEFSTYRF